MQPSLRRLVTIAMLTAMSYVLMFTLQIPLIPVAPYLKYDPSDVPTLIGGFMLGPIAGVTIAFLKALLFLLTKGTSGPIGSFMNFAASGSFVLVASLVYRRVNNAKGMLLGLTVGGLAMTAVMVPLNYYWALGAWGIPQVAHLNLIRTAVLPFNLARGAASTLITMPILLALKPVLLRMGYIDSK